MRRAHMCGILVRSSKTSYDPSSLCKSNHSYIHPQNAPWSADKLFAGPARISCFCGCSASIALERYIIPLRTNLQGGGEDGDSPRSLIVGRVAPRPTINERGLWWRFNSRHGAECACNRVGSHTTRAALACKMTCQYSTGKEL